ncbi:MAG TPA: hypothetical protein VK769_05725 [Verrucomicrobiae bacterium]|nr:hypothetical protein [Verrucomicrobiae bacterium]
MKRNIRPWMLAYTIFMAVFFAPAVRHDFTSWHLIFFAVWDWICDIIMIVGNLLFSLNRVPSAIRRPWKVVFPILVLEFFTNGIYDSLYGKHAQDDSAALLIFVWIVSVFFIFQRLGRIT